ncbi:MAG: hypothetical protein M9901_13380 [Lentimicrobium sp.]|nr:hypothetical protein [Lentimicrobium sp.]
MPNRSTTIISPINERTGSCETAYLFSPVLIAKPLVQRIVIQHQRILYLRQTGALPVVQVGQELWADNG